MELGREITVQLGQSMSFAIRHNMMLEENDPGRQELTELKHQFYFSHQVANRKLDKFIELFRRYLTPLKQQCTDIRANGMPSQEEEILLNHVNEMEINLEITITTICNRVKAYLEENPNPGLKPERIAMFRHFQARGNIIGDRCCCCLEDYVEGTILVEFDCEHIICRNCTNTWFSNNNTCPSCRHLHSFV